VAFEFIDCEVA